MLNIRLLDFVCVVFWVVKSTNAMQWWGFFYTSYNTNTSDQIRPLHSRMSEPNDDDDDGDGVDWLAIFFEVR